MALLLTGLLLALLSSMLAMAYGWSSPSFCNFASDCRVAANHARREGDGASINLWCLKNALDQAGAVWVGAGIHGRPLRLTVNIVMLPVIFRCWLTNIVNGILMALAWWLWHRWLCEAA
jgi:hypothetical protein